jgi:hypothetical protein
MNDDGSDAPVFDGFFGDFSVRLERAVHFIGPPELFKFGGVHYFKGNLKGLQTRLRILQTMILLAM